MCRFPHLLHIKSLFLPLSVTQYQHTRLPRLEGGKRGGRGCQSHARFHFRVNGAQFISLLLIEEFLSESFFGMGILELVAYFLVGFLISATFVKI